MPSIQSISLAFLALLATTNAQAVKVNDGGASGGCPGGCCIPVCNVIVDGDSLGGFGSAAFADTCKQRFDRKNGGTIDINDDHQVTWLVQEDGQIVVDIFRNSDKKYNRWALSNCQLASAGGSQCAPSGGGCDTKQILVEAQG